MRKGRRLGIDVGKARVGLAISDQDGILATPFQTVPRQNTPQETASLIGKAIDDYVFLEAYVGLPVSLAGTSTESTIDALRVAYAISEVCGLEIRLVDERLTTVSASANLRLAGKTAKNSRSVIDQEAAAIILEQALATEKNSGTPPGKALDNFERPQDEPAE
jgi:putative holliday junction resolvase